MSNPSIHVLFDWYELILMVRACIDIPEHIKIKVLLSQCYTHIAKAGGQNGYVHSCEFMNLFRLLMLYGDRVRLEYLGTDCFRYYVIVDGLDEEDEDKIWSILNITDGYESESVAFEFLQDIGYDTS